MGCKLGASLQDAQAAAEEKGARTCRPRCCDVVIAPLFGERRRYSARMPCAFTESAFVM